MKIRSARLRFQKKRNPRIIFQIDSGSGIIEKSFSLKSNDPQVARQVLNHIKAEIDLGTFDLNKYLKNYNETKLTLKEFFSQYLAFRQNEVNNKRLSEYTYKLDVLAVKLFLKFIPENRALASITKDDIDLWINSLDHLNDTTVNIRKRSLAAAFNYAYQNELINKNPFSRYKHGRLKSPYQENDEVRYLYDHEIELLRSYFQQRRGTWQLDMFELALYTGMREGGLFNIKIDDLYSKKINGKIAYFLRIVEKGNKARKIPLSQKARAIIEKRINLIESGKYIEIIEKTIPQPNKKNNYERAKQGFIFFEITHPDSISKAFRKARIRLNINDRKVTFHSTRHTFAVKYLENGGSLHRLQTILGHSSIELTRRIYGKDTEESIIQNIDELTDF